MKISFIFFQALFYLICIYKVQANFWNCLNRLEKGFLLLGHVSHPKGTRGGLSVWALGACGALGRHPEGLSAQALGTRGELARHLEGLSVRALGTRGELGRCLGGVSRCRLSGHMAYPECSRG